MGVSIITVADACQAERCSVSVHEALAVVEVADHILLNVTVCVIKIADLCQV